MIIGDPLHFAVESGISEVSERSSLLAIGFFVIHLGGHRYGRHAPDSTALGCSFDEVERRIAGRGSHVAPFSAEPDAGLIADSVRTAIYAESGHEFYFGLAAEEFSDLIYSHDLLWAPDGDEAFDDGSYVMQFDVGDQVRLIGFQSAGFDTYDPRTLRDVWIAQDSFYGILDQWRRAFEGERARLLEQG